MQCQVFALDETGIDRLAGGRLLQTGIQPLCIPEDHLRGNRDDLPTFALFDHLGREQIGMRTAAFVGKASSVAVAISRSGFLLELC